MNDEVHQVHVNVPEDIHNRLKAILPEHGAVTSLIRNFLIRYVNSYEKLDQSEESPFDKASKETITNSFIKRSSPDPIAGD